MERSSGVAPDIVKQIQGWTSLGADSEILDKVIEEHFPTRRDAVRTFKFLDLTVQGVGGAFAALGINISRTGVLFQITDARFAGEGEQEHLMPYTARVWQNFHGGFHVFLEDGAVRREADIVRVSGYCGKTSSLVLVGCRFREPLAAAECQQLGIPADDAA